MEEGLYAGYHTATGTDGTVTVVCDRCGTIRHESTATSPASAVERAARDGWTLTADQWARTWCPRCSTADLELRATLDHDNVLPSVHGGGNPSLTWMWRTSSVTIPLTHAMLERLCATARDTARLGVGAGRAPALPDGMVAGVEYETGERAWRVTVANAGASLSFPVDWKRLLMLAGRAGEALSDEG